MFLLLSRVWYDDVKYDMQSYLQILYHKSLDGRIAKKCDGKVLKIRPFTSIDLLAILQKGLDRAIFSYNFILEVRLSGVRALIAIFHIRKFYKI